MADTMIFAQNRRISWPNDILYKFWKIFMQKYALLISFAEYYGFPGTEIFFSENLIFALSNEV